MTLLWIGLGVGLAVVGNIFAIALAVSTARRECAFERAIREGASGGSFAVWR